MKKITGKMTNGVLQAQFVHCFFNCDAFKQKDIAYLNNVIAGTRLGEYLAFAGYGNIAFDEDDTQHRYPVISTTDENGNPLEWSRKTTNCLIYDFHKVGKNDMYDKLFLYHTCSHNGAGVWYGWVLLDKKTGKMTHRFFVGHDSMDLMQALNRMIHRLPIVKRNEELLIESRKKGRRYEIA